MNDFVKLAGAVAAGGIMRDLAKDLVGGPSAELKELRALRDDIARANGQPIPSEVERRERISAEYRAQFLPNGTERPEYTAHAKKCAVIATGIITLMWLALIAAIIVSVVGWAMMFANL